MKEKVMMAAILVAVSTVSALVLAGINDVSSDVIRRNQERRFKAAVLRALGTPFDGDRPEDAFRERIEVRSFPEGRLYLSVTGDEDKAVDGIAFKLKGPGFWGPISLVVGVDPDDFSIKGLEILEQEETPGLGARVEEERFRGQFAGKHLDDTITVQVKGMKPGPNDVSAITGATFTSKALEAIINETSRKFIEAIKSLRRDKNA